MTINLICEWSFHERRNTFHSVIQCGVFKNNTRSVFVDKREYTGPLWKQVEQAHDYVPRNIHLGARFVGIYRQDVYELPPDSILELISNAVMNCSFLQNSHIQVAIYDDRLEITSPGGLLPGMTIQKMQEGYSKIRNKALAHAFLYMNMIEEWGSDIPKIMREMKECGLREPEFIDMGIGFRVNLYRKQDVDPSQEAFYTSQETNTKSCNTSHEMNQDDVSETELTNTDKIRNAIAKSPSVTQQELQGLTGLSRSGVRYMLQQMRAAVSGKQEQSMA